jgi:hypothetical protein
VVTGRRPDGRGTSAGFACSSASPGPPGTIAEDGNGDPDFIDEHFDALRAPPILLAVRGALVTTGATQLDYLHGRHATTLGEPLSS